ncbi:hypothetical protein [Hyphococcus sp.]|jgi:hypothetical protein
MKQNDSRDDGIIDREDDIVELGSVTELTKGFLAEPPETQDGEN